MANLLKHHQHKTWTVCNRTTIQSRARNLLAHKRSIISAFLVSLIVFH